jgi:hypothetical protein
MGKCYALGIGVEKDRHIAIQWYQEAIDAGEIRSHCDVGWLYLHGCSDITPNKVEAFRLLSIGAMNGIPAARACIGKMLVTGDGVPTNTRLGLSILHASFDSGYNNAGTILADLYFAGTHLDRDIDLAHDWLAKVAARGDARTMAMLGHYLVTGSHGKQDIEQGLALLNESMEKEYLFSYLWVGTLYRNGKSMEPDIGKAIECFKRGATAGDKRCGQALLELTNDGRRTPTSSTVPLAGF